MDNSKIARFSKASLRKPQPGARKPKILLVDDLPSNLKLMRVLLSSERCSVCTAADAEDALLVVMDEPPDLIVTDLHVPGIGGVALI